MPTPDDDDIDDEVCFCFCFRDLRRICLWAVVTSSVALLWESPADDILLSNASSEIFKVFAKSLTVVCAIFYLNQCSLAFIIISEAASSEISIISINSSVASSAKSSLFLMPDLVSAFTCSSLNSRSVNDS